MAQGASGTKGNKKAAGERSCDHFHCCSCYWTLAIAGKEALLPERKRAALKKLQVKKTGKKLLPNHNPGENSAGRSGLAWPVSDLRTGITW